MAEYELLYFPARGRAEQIRLLFAMAGHPFRDTPASWPELKPTMPFGRLPVMTERADDGELMLAESGAIMRHLARRFDLYGRSVREHALCDALADFIADERAKYITVAYASLLKTSEAAIEAFWQQLPQALDSLSRIAGASSSGWLVGDAPTFADVAVFDYLDGLLGLRPEVLKDHPVLAAFVERVRGLPGIAAHIAARG
jgi:glutathione S-transferase